MARAKAIQQSEYPYHITGRCINREWFQLPMEEVWRIFSEELKKTHEDKKLQIHAFVLMTNHYHLLASTPEANISQCMHQFMHATSKRLTRAGNRINQTYAGRHYKTILQSHFYYLNTYKYIYRNPVDAGLSEKAEDYSYSTFSAVVGRQPHSIPIEIDSFYENDPNNTIQWVNTKPPAHHLEAIRWALKRQQFKYKKSRVTNEPEMNENDLL